MWMLSIGQNLLAFPDFTSCLLQKQGVAQLLRSPGVYGLLSILSWLPFAFLQYVLPPSVPCINVLTPQWMFISYIRLGLDSHQVRTKQGSAWRWTETPDDGALKFIYLVLIKVWMRVCTRAEDTLRFQWRRTYVDILGNVLCCSVGLLENHQHTWRFALQVCWTERWFCWSWLSHFFAISYPFAFVSRHRLGILPPMWTWWLSGAVFKSADVVSTHQTVTETFVSWGLWPGISITGEVWEAVVVVATSQLWWLWQLISRADGSFEILLWLHILECLLYFF